VWIVTRHPRGVMRTAFHNFFFLSNIELTSAARSKQRFTNSVSQRKQFDATRILSSSLSANQLVFSTRYRTFVASSINLSRLFGQSLSKNVRHA
jgi:hypothetical protein